jgi:hypothetical protein
MPRLRPPADPPAGGKASHSHPGAQDGGTTGHDLQLCDKPMTAPGHVGESTCPGCGAVYHYDEGARLKPGEARRAVEAERERLLAAFREVGRLTRGIAHVGHPSAASDLAKIREIAERETGISIAEYT